VAWSLKKDEIMKDQPGTTREKFLYNLSRSSYEKNWGKDYQSPTTGDTILAFLIRILPKIGPLRVLQLKTTPATEKLFEASFNKSLDRYKQFLHQIAVGQPILPNYNFDTGDVTGPGKYELNDEAQAKLLDELAKHNFNSATPEIRTELLEFFGHPDAPYAVRRKPKDWAKVQADLEQLKNARLSVATRSDD
jgi:hypothetical protein